MCPIKRPLATPSGVDSSNNISVETIVMNAPANRTLKNRVGKVKYGILAWMLGLPLPIVILALFFRGCDF
jgi:hypothetical protein